MGSAVSYCKSESVEHESTSPEEVPQKSEEDLSSAKATEDAEDEEEAEAADDGGGDEDSEEEESKPTIEVKSSPYDPRFPTTNQARNCYTRYNEFYRCAGQKSEDDDECKFYQRAYRSLCPGEWVDKWNEQRENGNWAGKY